MANKKLKAEALLNLSSVGNIISEIKTDFAHRIKELKTDQEKSFFQDLTQDLYDKLGNFNTTSEEIKKIAKQLFLEFRCNTEVGLEIHFTQNPWVKDKIVGSVYTNIRYGLGCNTYSSFQNKLSLAA